MLVLRPGFRKATSGIVIRTFIERTVGRELHRASNAVIYQVLLDGKTVWERKEKITSNAKSQKRRRRMAQAQERFAENLNVSN